MHRPEAGLQSGSLEGREQPAQDDTGKRARQNDQNEAKAPGTDALVMPVAQSPARMSHPAAQTTGQRKNRAHDRPPDSAGGTRPDHETGPVDSAECTARDSTPTKPAIASSL